MSNLLTLHGTQAFRLSPSSVVAAARADIARRRGNIEGPPYEPYAFHSADVRRATSVRDLIARASRNIERRRQTTGKKNTLLIYDPALLADALAAAPPR